MEANKDWGTVEQTVTRRVSKTVEGTSGLKGKKLRQLIEIYGEEKASPHFFLSNSEHDSASQDKLQSESEGARARSSI
jgi:hypothetical protein